MILWSGLLSPFSAKVRIACSEKNISYERRDVPWSRKTLWGPKPEEFLAVAPRAQVPVLITDDGRAIADSTVIVEYLEETYPDPPLLPHDPVERALCRLLEDDADRAISDPITVLVREVFLKPDGVGRHEAAVAEATERLHAFFARLESQLVDGDFLFGHFSVAEAPSFITVGYAGIMGVPVPDGMPRVASWYQRTLNRPSVGNEFTAMLAAAARA
jgi:glutathione S-transferase